MIRWVILAAIVCGVAGFIAGDQVELRYCRSYYGAGARYMGDFGPGSNGFVWRYNEANTR